MKKIKHTNQEKAEILGKIMLTIGDIAILNDRGRPWASEEVKRFKSWFKETYAQEIDCVPTVEYLRFSGYPEQRILKYARAGY